MAGVRSQRAGRKNNNDRIRELVALFGSLHNTGDSITIEAISSRLGMSQAEAQAMVDIVCQASGEEINGLLISSNDDETEYTLQYPGTHGVPIRLTSSETIAVLHALDVAGIDEDDSLRKRIRECFASSEVAEDEVRKALGAPTTAQEPLYLCALAIAESRQITLMYKGLKDKDPRSRKILPRQLVTHNDSWYVIADDLEIHEERRFRLDRMADVSLDDIVDDVRTSSSKEPEHVRITFLDRTYYDAFDWPGIRLLSQEGSTIVCDLPYYGSGTWLLRRICAGNGSITVDDKRIMQMASDYARNLLATL